LGFNFKALFEPFAGHGVQFLETHKPGSKKMKNKKLSMVMITTVLCLALMVTSAWAGPEQRYRWEGVAIGLGAAILGNALFNAPYYAQPAPAPVYYSAPPVYYRPAPVYYSPPPVYYGPPLVYYRPAPAYYGPPVVRPYVGCRPYHRSRYGPW
jgi:hypothetical protein